ncbi:MAG TPA: HlyD family efflux transporter periplasmic adaptor subunit [Candidatus Acidoferrum sp.]|nr:HlyD family efflux transporter periplasmic adaptor subunit [Candidatus Acidoferrum sp.]
MSDLTSHRTMTDTEPTSAPVEILLRAPQSSRAGKGHGASPSHAPWRRPVLWVAFLALAVICAAVYFFHRTQTGNQTAGETQRTARVELRDFVRSLRVNGTVEATESFPITAPRLAGQTNTNLTITMLPPTGTRVHKGDLLVEFDRQTQIRNALDREADYNDFLRQIDKLRATQAATVAVDDADLKAQEDAVKTAELELKKSEVQSRIQAEKNKENLDEANAKLKQLRDTYQLKRTSDAAAIRVLEIQRDSSKLAMEHARANSDLLAIHSPTDGLVVITQTWKSQGPSDWSVGDDTYGGATLMQVVNPNSMRVRAQVNQQDIPAVQEGQRVEIRLDAYPDLVFHGRVNQVSAIGTTGAFSDKVHSFVVLFTIDGTNANLLPDLSASVDVEMDRTPNALVIPRDAVIHRDGKTFVRVVKGNTSEEREVKISKSDEVEVVVESGVQAGDTLIRTAESDGKPATKPGVVSAKN